MSRRSWHILFSLTFGLLLTASFAFAAESWKPVTLADPRQVELGGPTGSSLSRGLARLSLPPYTADWLLADVSFKVNRIFTNYSGDVSGRFLELATLTSPPGHPSPSTLPSVASEIDGYQKPDGHFGLDMDLTKRMERLSPPIPMLWGNARLLVGLLAAANYLHDTNLLAAARRLGDFYVDTADIFCSPAREAELQATGTGGDGYTCCYFPAIEGLTLLYRATHDQRYLAQAGRMAEWFKKFDALPTDHSHGNLCAWRGILELYDLTGEPSYLERAVKKWEHAVHDHFVWPLGGVGEHWFVMHGGDEGCSESDWLRFNLQLWRFTGEPRYLSMAERLLENQYSANQCANGGYGWRPFDGDAAGPIGTTGNLDEWYFCCSFHGPLGLHFLKAYLAAASDAGIFVNLLQDFSSTVNCRKDEWRVTVREQSAAHDDEPAFEVEVRPLSGKKPAATTLWLRKPDWAVNLRITSASGAPIPFSLHRGYARLEPKFREAGRVRLAFQTGLRLERRGFEPVSLSDPANISRLHDVAFIQGPNVLFAAPAPAPARLILLAQTDPLGRPALLKSSDGAYFSLALPALDCGLDQITNALRQAQPVILRPESQFHTRRRLAFMHDVVIVPSRLLPEGSVSKFLERARATGTSAQGGGFGEHLENRPDAWLHNSGWEFGSNALHITGGDVGLLDFQPGSNYRFEFDVELPTEGQGIAGWIVRAQSQGDFVMFQIQSADSTYSAPEFKTRPNTLRPHIRRYGEWTIADPIPLPKEIRRGETHHLAVECSGSQITVLLDGQNIYTGSDGGFSMGTVGFRATSPAEQAVLRNIALKKQ